LEFLLLWDGGAMCEFVEETKQSEHREPGLKKIYVRIFY
jgi:hypothetical protein